MISLGVIYHGEWVWFGPSRAMSGEHFLEAYGFEGDTIAAFIWLILLIADIHWIFLLLYRRKRGITHSYTYSNTNLYALKFSRPNVVGR